MPSVVFVLICYAIRSCFMNLYYFEVRAGPHFFAMGCILGPKVRDDTSDVSVTVCCSAGGTVSRPHARNWT